MRLSIGPRLLFFLFLIPTQAFSLNSFMSLGYGSGGTELRDVTGGQDYDLRAGSGFFLSGGILVPISPTRPHQFEGQFGIGYLFQDGHQKEDSVSWSRVPIEAIYYYRNTRELFRLGWGLTYHFKNKISAKGNGSSLSADVDNALGWVFAAEKLFPMANNKKGKLGLGVRFQKISYSSPRFSKKANGDAFFATMTLLFF